MKKNTQKSGKLFQGLWNIIPLNMQSKLLLIFLLSKVLPLIFLTVFAWWQISSLGAKLQEMAVKDSTEALNRSAVENIERMSTDAAKSVAEFLYARDDDILYLSGIEPTEEAFRQFINAKTGRLVKQGEWQLAEDGASWVETVPPASPELPPSVWVGGVSQNPENNDFDSFNYREQRVIVYENFSLYDEISYIDLDGNELVKVVAQNSTKRHYPLDSALRDVSRRENTYVNAETYFDELRKLRPGEIFVSDVIGTYVRTNLIGMYTPDGVAKAAEARGYDIEFSPEAQAFAGQENPNGQRFEGIIRWATPVVDEYGTVTGYVTFALNHDHIMAFVDHITPMNERYTVLNSAHEGNYAFIWDYNCRSIVHPRHHSITGFDPETGLRQIPWLESSIYDAWQESGVSYWYDFAADIPTFDNQSREKRPAPALTQAGLVGLDGRYLNNAPQCTGWMDLTAEGGSGSFYILWSGVYKLNTAAAIPYYTGQYAPSEANGFSKRGFGFIAIGAGLDDFEAPAIETGHRLTATIGRHMAFSNAGLVVGAIGLIALVVLIAIWISYSLTSSITSLINGISIFRSGERQFRFNAKAKDEFGFLADSFDDMADSIVASVKYPLAITDMNCNIIYMNDYGLELRGRSLDEVVGASYYDAALYPAKSRYDPILALKEGRESDTFYEMKSGEFIRGTANYFLSKEGERIGYIVETYIVTDMVLEQIKIEEQRALLDKIFSSSPDVMWYQNADGVYQVVNPRFATLTGQNPEEFVGKTATDMLPDYIAERSRTMSPKALASQTPVYSEEKVTFADGHEETIDVVRVPIFDSSGVAMGLLGFGRDVSTRVAIENALLQTQDELKQAVESANRANEHKGEFLARMSHEIRTPMNAIIGLTNIVQKKLGGILEGHGLDGELGDISGNIDQIESSSQHLLGLLNDVLDISKIEAGKIVLSEEAMELDKLAHTVTGIIRPRCDEKNITFITAFDAFSPASFLSDSLRLRQVLINLLGNAVKFTPELGTIEFLVEKVRQGNGKVLVRFVVRDSGIGIAEESLDAIFKPFEQENNQISRNYGGTGLGLAISRRIIQLFGGDITVNSAVGKGSEFSFEIWLREVNGHAINQTETLDASGKFAGKRALLVDDVDINRMIVLALLEDTGMEIDEAADGREAVERLQSSPPGHYDIVFMDVQMPVMDGHEATSAIRGMDRPDVKDIPIIALTANAFQDDIDKGTRCGMNAHITKPVELDRLVEILFRFLGAD